MELNELQCCDTLKSNHDSVGAAQFPRFIPTQCPNSVPKLLKCSLCSAAHIYVNSYSLWWRWTKHHTGVILWWTPSLNPEDFLSSEPDHKHSWTSIKEKMPSVWLGPVCIRVNLSVANWAWILNWVFFMHFFLATARHGLLIVEVLDFHWRKLFFWWFCWCPVQKGLHWK